MRDYRQYVSDSAMNDTLVLRGQAKILRERIQMAYAQNTLVHNLKSTKARSRFIQEANLNVNIYKYEPSDHLELQVADKKLMYPEEFERFKEFKEREYAKLEYDQWIAQERVSKQNQNMKGNLALTFLFKDQDLHEIIKFKARD